MPEISDKEYASLKEMAAKAKEVDSLTAKLADLEAAKEAAEKKAIESENATVEQLRAEIKKIAQQRDDWKAKLNDQSEKHKAEIAARNEADKQRDEQARKEKLLEAVKSKLRESGVTDEKSLKLAAYEIALDGVEMTEKGEIKGADKEAERIVKEYPALVAQAGPPQKSGGANVHAIQDKGMRDIRTSDGKIDHKAIFQNLTLSIEKDIT